MEQNQNPVWPDTSLFFPLQTILIQNIYRNPQNSAQTADASRCKLKICQQPPFSVS